MGRKYYSPLRYPGGKDKIFSFVSSLIEENNLIGINYAEPYAGGAGLALHLLYSEYVGKIYINDLSPAIYAFWRVILDRSDDFCKWIEDVPVDMTSWHYYKELQSSTDCFDLAKSTFFLNRTNVSGVLKGGVIGGLNQTGKYKIDARFNKKDLIERIQSISKMRDRIQLSNMDGIQFVNCINRRKENVFINLDPPYYEDGRDLYLNFYNDKDHKSLSKCVERINKYWMVSYDNTEFITNLYRQYDLIKYRLSSGTSNGMGEEIIILPHFIKFQKSMSELDLIN